MTTLIRDELTNVSLLTPFLDTYPGSVEYRRTVRQHDNMLDAKGKAKVLTSEAAERSASVDPQHQVTTADAKGKRLIQEGTNSGRPPRSGIVITHRRPRETWQQRKDRYRRQQEDYYREEERRRQEWNRHKDHWNCPFFLHY